MRDYHSTKGSDGSPSYIRTRSTSLFLLPSKDIGKYEEPKRRHSEPIPPLVGSGRVMFPNKMTEQDISPCRTMRPREKFLGAPAPVSRYKGQKIRKNASSSISNEYEVHGRADVVKREQERTQRRKTKEQTEAEGRGCWTPCRRDSVEMWRKNARKSLHLTSVQPSHSHTEPKNISPIKQEKTVLPDPILSLISTDLSLSLSGIKLGEGGEDALDKRVKQKSVRRRNPRGTRFKSFCTDLTETIEEVTEEEEEEVDPEKEEDGRHFGEAFSSVLASPPSPTSWDSMGVLGLSSRLSRDTMQAKQDMLVNHSWNHLNMKQKTDPVKITSDPTFKECIDRFSNRIERERDGSLSDSFYRKQSVSTHAM